jgi:hypothetical protein
MREVPIRNVVSGVAKDIGTSDQNGRQIHPSLIGKHVPWYVDTTMQKAPVCPPPGKPTAVLVVAQS